MRDKLNQFVANLNGQFVEVSYEAARNQCMDLMYNWVFALGYPKATVQHLWAKQVWTEPNDLTRKYFDLIPNTPDFVPQDGDIVVYDGTVGHVAIALGGGNTTEFKQFEQNSPLGSNCHIGSSNYSKCLGFLRPKVVDNVPEKEWTDQTLIPIGGEWGNMELQAVRGVLNDQKRDIEACKGNIDKLNGELAQAEKDIYGLENEINALIKQLKECQDKPPIVCGEFKKTLARFFHELAVAIEGK